MQVIRTPREPEEPRRRLRWWFQQSTVNPGARLRRPSTCLSRMNIVVTIVVVLYTLALVTGSDSWPQEPAPRIHIKHRKSSRPKPLYLFLLFLLLFTRMPFFLTQPSSTREGQYWLRILQQPRIQESGSHEIRSRYLARTMAHVLCAAQTSGESLLSPHPELGIYSDFFFLI